MDGSETIPIPPMAARAFTVRAGQTVRIVDVAGGQPGDFVAFKTDDLSVRFSQARTRVENRKVRVTAGDALWTNEAVPRTMFTITSDTYGNHDLLYTPCCRYALEKRFDVYRDGCLENLIRALGPWDVSAQQLPDPLNLFFAGSVDEKGRLDIRDAASAPGDFIELKAEMDCLAAVSTCAVPLPGRQNSAYKIRIFDKKDRV